VIFLRKVVCVMKKNDRCGVMLLMFSLVLMVVCM